MSRPRAYLAFKRIEAQPGPAQGTIITLHGAGKGMDHTLPFMANVAPDWTTIAARGFWGVHKGPDVIGSTWYRYWSLMEPEPSTFGFSLVELERFIIDELERQPGDDVRLPVLLGVEQGALIALAVATVMPDLLAGVIAIAGALPNVHGWEPPMKEANGLPLLLVSDPNQEMVSADALAKTVDAMQARGIDVTHEVVPDAVTLGSAVQDVVRAWLSE